jgi:protocatechuate 3,4-dioxygenase beta subunit
MRDEESKSVSLKCWILNKHSKSEGNFPPEMAADPELRSLLRKYQPQPPSSLEGRVMSSYHQEIRQPHSRFSRPLPWTWRFAAMALLGIALLYAAVRVATFLRTSNVQNPTFATGEQKGGLPPSNTAISPSANAGAQNFAIPSVSEGIPPTVIQVRVIERVTGRPVPNAALLLAAAMAVKDMVLAEAPHTDGDGRCTIPAPKKSTWLTVRAEGFVPHHLRLPTVEEIPHEYVFKLDKGASIGGFVLDESGQPLENVKLSINASNSLFDSKNSVRDLEGHDNWVYAQTDKGGRWTATELVPDPEWISLTLDHPERVSVTYDTTQVLTGIDPTRGRASINDLKDGKAILVMKNGMVVSGKVIDEAGRGIEGGEVIQSDGGLSFARNWMLDPAKTDANGQFTLRIAKAGDITIYIQAKGFAPEERAVKVVPGLPLVEFRLKKGEIIGGRVVDEGGNPIPGATIRTGSALPGRIQPFSWSGKTDDNGRFVWDSAPAKALSYSVSALGYDPATPQVLAPGKEHEIRLAKGSQLIITGKVTDAKTKMPMDAFKVSALPANSQMVLKSFDGMGGEFTLTMPVRSTPPTIGGREMPFPIYGILVEADGYVPDLSQSVEGKPGNQYVEISLVRGSGLSGIVLLPNGSPAASAGVFLCGGSNTPPNLPSGAAVSTIGATMINNFKSIGCSGSGLGNSPFAAATETDASGRFSLKAVAQAHSFYAVHEKGFAAIVPENLPASGNITLQPWGRIMGIVMVGSKPGANQTLSLSSLALTQRPPDLRVTLTTTTDSEGRIEFASVPPGEYRISHRPSTGSGGNSAVVVVRSGETASIRIGGTGRPLTGRIVATGSDPNVTPKIQSANLSLKLPDENIPSPTDAVAYRQWMESEAALARSRAQRSYTLRPDADGTFRIEDIPAGTYTLTVIVNSSGRSESQPGMTIGFERLTKEIVVPEMPGGRSDEPLNLGIITLQLPPKK